MNRFCQGVATFLAFVAGGVSSAETAPSLLSNGSLEQVNAKGWPLGWPQTDGVSVEKDGKTRFLRLQSSKPGQTVTVYRRVELPQPPPAGLEIRLRVRHSDIQSGEHTWNDGRVIAHFKNPAGRTLKPEPPAQAFRGTSKGWTERSYFIKVPVSASYLEVMPMLMQPKAGTLDLAQCLVLPATQQQLDAARGPIVRSETVNPIYDPGELHVVGNELHTRHGQRVWLQGLCVDSLEWSAKGERIDKSIRVANGTWHANVIRLPVRDDFWFGRGPFQGKDGGIAYRKIVDSAIANAGVNGAYVVLDLHRFGAPMAPHVEFWKDAATRYRNHPAVIFELFNEPHDISWQLWRDGGNLTDAKNKGELTGETTTGVQALLDAVRSTGARNIVIAGGLGWSYDLSGILQGYALVERPGGNGIMYSSHIYPWKRDWQAKVLAAAEKHPLFIGEVGCPPDWKGFQFIPPSERFEDLTSDAWPRDVLAMIQKHRLNWTGFSFHPRCGPMVISDWDYTPTPYWGAFVKDALAGKQFELKKLR